MRVGSTLGPSGPMLAAGALKPLRFGKNGLPKLILNTVIQECGYCGTTLDTYAPIRPAQPPLTLEDLQKALGISWPALSPDAYKEANTRADELIREAGQAVHDLEAAEAAKQGDNAPSAPSSHDKNMPTYDHIRPENAFARKDLVDHSLSNGILTCGRCNFHRGNIPLLEFLQGESVRYIYTKKNDQITEAHRSDDRPHPPSAEELEQRQKAFSNYLKRFVQAGTPMNGSPERNGWFIHALDNMLFPVWKEGKAPRTRLEYDRCYNARVKSLIKLLAKADRAYWLGPDFKAVVKTDFRQNPQAQDALLRGIQSARASILAKEPHVRFMPPRTPKANPFAVLKERMDSKRESA